VTAHRRKTSPNHGFDVVAQFEDKGVSGGTADRSGYQALLSATLRKEFSVIVVEGARFDWAGLAETRKVFINPQIRIGSGGRIC
jgi:hypothetical protein